MIIGSWPRHSSSQDAPSTPSWHERSRRGPQLAGRTVADISSRESPSRSLNSTAQGWGAGIQVPIPHIPRGPLSPAPAALVEPPRSPQETASSKSHCSLSQSIWNVPVEAVFKSHAGLPKTHLTHTVFLSWEQSQPGHWRSRSPAEGEMVSWMPFFHWYKVHSKAT